MTDALRIATDDRRLLERVFGGLRDLLRQRVLAMGKPSAATSLLALSRL